jgi:hypothetical protein
LIADVHFEFSGLPFLIKSCFSLHSFPVQRYVLRIRLLLKTAINETPTSAKTASQIEEIPIIPRVRKTT